MPTILINMNTEKVLEEMKNNLSVKIKPLMFRKKGDAEHILSVFVNVDNCLNICSGIYFMDYKGNFVAHKDVMCYIIIDSDGYYIFKRCDGMSTIIGKFDSSRDMVYEKRKGNKGYFADDIIVVNNALSIKKYNQKIEIEYHDSITFDTCNVTSMEKMDNGICESVFNSIKTLKEI